MKKHCFLLKVFALLALFMASNLVTYADDIKFHAAEGSEGDTDEYFTGRGEVYGPRTQVGLLEKAALRQAQDAVRQKMKHRVTGSIVETTTSADNGNGLIVSTSATVQKINHEIDDIINDTKQHGPTQISNMDDKGNVYCVVSVRVDKKNAAKKIARVISEDKELRRHYKEDQLRFSIERSFKEINE